MKKDFWIREAGPKNFYTHDLPLYFIRNNVSKTHDPIGIIINKDSNYYPHGNTIFEYGDKSYCVDRKLKDNEVIVLILQGVIKV